MTFRFQNGLSLHTVKSNILAIHLKRPYVSRGYIRELKLTLQRVGGPSRIAVRQPSGDNPQTPTVCHVCRDERPIYTYLWSDLGISETWCKGDEAPTISVDNFKVARVLEDGYCEFLYTETC